MSFLVTAGSVALGLPVAYFIVRTRSRVLRVLTLVVLLVPFLMGEIVRTFAWYMILANRGALGWFASLFGVEDGGILGTPLGVFIGMLQVSVPLVALLVLTGSLQSEPDCGLTGLEALAPTSCWLPPSCWCRCSSTCQGTRRRTGSWVAGRDSRRSRPE